jgi:adenine-specific DNA-methyltransferase
MQTEGIKYAGSKLKLLPYIMETVLNLDGVNTILDGFSGSTRVSQAFALTGHSVISNDISIWSEVFASCYLLSGKPDGFYKEKIDYLNSLKGYEGWFSRHYGSDSDDAKKPFRKKNAQKLDIIRDEIAQMDLSREDESVLLTSLILALDKVDNTLGHYAAYLSKWSRRSFNDLKLELPKRVKSGEKHFVVRDDIFNTVTKYRADLAYFDPPYGSNNEKMPPSRVRYASYYHLWTTIIKNDKPALFGKANRREDTRDNRSASVFEDFKKDENGDFFALEALRKLIDKTNARYLLLSYSSGGRLTKEQLFSVLNETGTIKEQKIIDYRKNVMSSMRSTNKWVPDGEKNHYEYLFLLEKQF